MHQRFLISSKTPPWWAFVESRGTVTALLFEINHCTTQWPRVPREPTYTNSNDTSCQQHDILNSTCCNTNSDPFVAIFGVSAPKAHHSRRSVVESTYFVAVVGFAVKVFSVSKACTGSCAGSLWDLDELQMVEKNTHHCQRGSNKNTRFQNLSGHVEGLNSEQTATSNGYPMISVYGHNTTKIHKSPPETPESCNFSLRDFPIFLSPDRNKTPAIQHV